MVDMATDTTKFFPQLGGGLIAGNPLQHLSFRRKDHRRRVNTHTGRLNEILIPIDVDRNRNETPIYVASDTRIAKRMLRHSLAGAAPRRGEFDQHRLVVAFRLDSGGSQIGSGLPPQRQYLPKRLRPQPVAIRTVSVLKSVSSLIFS